MLLNHFKNIHREINFQVPSVFIFFIFVTFKVCIKTIKEFRNCDGTNTSLALIKIDETYFLLIISNKQCTLMMFLLYLGVCRGCCWSVRCSPILYNSRGLRHARLSCPSLSPKVWSNVHWVQDAISTSHLLLPSYLCASNLSQHQDLFQWAASSHQEAKVLEFQLQHQSFQWIFRTDFL